MTDGLAILGVGLGVISYSSLYLGKGIQKRGVEGLKADRTIKSRHSAVWIVGTVLTATPTFLQWAALIFAPINIIAPLAAESWRVAEAQRRPGHRGCCLGVDVLLPALEEAGFVVAGFSPDEVAIRMFSWRFGRDDPAQIPVLEAHTPLRFPRGE